MGGCASAPKDLKKDGGGGSAPVPEPSREEETVEAEQEGVEKVGEENIEKNGDKKSLGSLLDEDEIEKESAKESKAEEVPSEKKHNSSE